MSEQNETGNLGQCVYEMSTGKRCQKDAQTVLKYGSVWAKKPPAYGYCHDHAFSVTRPRDPRIHRTAEPLIEIEEPLRIYLAAAYSRRVEMVAIAERLIAAGHEVTARWIQGLHEMPPDGIAVDSREHHAWCAADDVEDIDSADVLLSVTGGGRRGGRHAEFGYALAVGKRLMLIGEREHVFHNLPNVEQYDDLDAVIAALDGSGLEQAA